jgi:hypothetical protein
MLKAMGRELGGIHLGSVDPSAQIERDLKRRKKTWLRDAAEAAQRKVRSDFAEWTGAHPTVKKKDKSEKKAK